MKKKIKAIGILLTCILVSALLAGCGTNKDYEGEGEIQTLEKGVLKVGMNMKNQPMSYVDEETAKPVGLEAELASAIAEKLGLKLEIVDTTEKNLLNSLDADLYDCAISSIGISDWNTKEYSATEPYADIKSVKDKIQSNTDYTQIAVFGKKGTPLIPAIQNQALTPLKTDGTLTNLSQKYLETDITIQ